VEKHLFDFADRNLSERVEQGRHALSIDEQRYDFTPTPWSPRADGSIKQVWFPGVHADVGGGYPETGLSDVALQWMLDEVAALGPELGVAAGRLEPPVRPDPLQNRHDEARKPLWKLRPREARHIEPDAELHPSVLRRIRDRTDYRPESLSGHPQAAPFFTGSAPPEDILETGEHLPIQHLEPGESVQDEAFAQNCWSSLGLGVHKGERYEISAEGEWSDKQYRATASGYASPNLLLRLSEGSRRVEQADWFRLIACVHPESNLEARNPDAGNLLTGLVQSMIRDVSDVDAASQLQAVGTEGQQQIEVDRDGFLYVFANDAPWAYSNNSGYLSVTVTRKP